MAATLSRSVYLDDLQAEFPRIDDRRAGLCNQHSWFAAATTHGAGGAFNSIAHVDNRTCRRRLYELPSGDATSEPVFVPRTADAPEGDGWLLATVWRAAENRSDLLVLEAANVDRGPVAIGGACQPRALRTARQLGARRLIADSNPTAGVSGGPCLRRVMAHGSGHRSSGCGARLI